MTLPQLFNEQVDLPSFRKVFQQHLTHHHRFVEPLRSSSSHFVPPLNRIPPSPSRIDYNSASSSSSSPSKSSSNHHCHRERTKRGICQFHAGCSKRARKGGLCVSHGGGRRCGVPNCTRAVQTGGVDGRCFAHGGGKRCIVSNCSRGVVRENFCREHFALAERQNGKWIVE